MGRRNHQRGQRRFALLRAATSLTPFSVMHWITEHQGERLFESGQVERIYNDGELIGYRFYSDRQKFDIHRAPTATSITADEMFRYGLRHWPGAGSRTKGKSEVQRMTRVGKDGRPLPMEDAMERLEAKVNAFAPRQSSAA